MLLILFGGVLTRAKHSWLARPRRTTSNSPGYDTPLAEGTLLALARGRAESDTCNVFLSLRLEPSLSFSVREQKTQNVGVSAEISLVKTFNFSLSPTPPHRSHCHLAPNQNESSTFTKSTFIGVDDTIERTPVTVS